MSDLTKLSIAEIREGLAARQFSATELTKGYIAAIEKARDLNAYVCETPDKALAMAAASDERLAKGEGRALEGVPLGIKDLFCTEGVHSQAGSHVLDGFKPVYEFDRHEQSVGRWRGDARQAQHGRVRHGLVQRDLLLRPGGQSVALEGLERAAGAGRFVGRFGGGGRRAALRRGDGDRYRRLDPPAGGLHRHRRHQADLWPLLALGHRRLRLLARPGRPDRARRARRRDPPEVDGEQSTPRTRPRPTGRCPTTRRRSAEASRA